MNDIKELCRALPIKYDNKILDLLTFKDIDWYVNNCMQSYFNEFLDFKFSTQLNEAELQTHLYNAIISYTFRVKSSSEARLLLKDRKSSTIYGGCTVFNTKNSCIELAYFVVPEHHNKGIATDMLNHLVYALCNSNMAFDKLKIVIREDNIASLKLADKLGFKLNSTEKGKYKMNKVYILERKERIQ